MSKYYYKRSNKKIKKFARIAGIGIFFAGAGILAYVFFPLLSWQIYFAPVFASQNIETPIPKSSVITKTSVIDLLSTAASSIGVDYTNANNWYPTNRVGRSNVIPQYLLSIPKIGVSNAIVSTIDSDLTQHLIQYNTDSVPPLWGNTIIFGHSTLPQLFDEKNYKTIFANAYKIETGDEIFVKIKDVTYKYKVQSTTVVDPQDTSPLAQNFTDSFITIITCTPPGTIWKRLIIKAKIENLNG